MLCSFRVQDLYKTRYRQRVPMETSKFLAEVKGL